MYSIFIQVVSSTWSIQPNLLDFFPVSRMPITLGRTISAVAKINCNPSKKKKNRYSSCLRLRQQSTEILIRGATCQQNIEFRIFNQTKLFQSNKPRFYVKLDEHVRKVLDSKKKTVF